MYQTAAIYSTSESHGWINREGNLCVSYLTNVILVVSFLNQKERRRRLRRRKKIEEKHFPSDFKVTTSFLFIIEIQLRLVLSRREKERKVAGPSGRRPAELSLLEEREREREKNAAVCGTRLYIICTYKKWNCVLYINILLSHFFRFSWEVEEKERRAGRWTGTPSWLAEQLQRGTNM